jgi:hypothetical protein
MLKLTVNATPASVAEASCPVCEAPVKLNEIVRSAYHVLGCKHCYASRAATMVTRRLA